MFYGNMEERDAKIKYTIIDDSEELEGIANHDDLFDKESFEMNVVFAAPERKRNEGFMKFCEDLAVS